MYAEGVEAPPAPTVGAPAGPVGPVAASSLLAFARGVLVRCGVPEPDARLVGDSLVTAELWGHSSHGMLRLPWYVDRLRSGAMAAVTEPRIVTDTGSTVLLDGRDGIGQVLAHRATLLGIERAKQHGISAVGVRNSNHFGTAAYFTRIAAGAGCVAILCTNASPAMAPWGGRERTLGTNPWSIAAPAGRYGTVVMDMANTAVARGKIYLAAERGTPIPEGWAADTRGRPTTDPQQALAGLILPVGGAKGYVMSFMFDVLAGVLTGSRFGADVAGPYEADRRSGCGHFLVTIDVAALAEPHEFAARVETLVEQTKSVPLADGVAEIFHPGELENRSHVAHAVAGISLAAATWDSLRSLSERYDVPMPEAASEQKEQGEAR